MVKHRQAELAELFDREMVHGEHAKWLMSFDVGVEVRSLAKHHGFHVRKLVVSYSLANTVGSRARRGVSFGPRTNDPRCHL